MVSVEQRLSKVEQRTSRLEGQYEHLATKADLERLQSRLVMWLVGVGIAVIGVISAIIRFLIEN